MYSLSRAWVRVCEVRCASVCACLPVVGPHRKTGMLQCHHTQPDSRLQATQTNKHPLTSLRQGRPKNRTVAWDNQDPARSTSWSGTAHPQSNRAARAEAKPAFEHDHKVFMPKREKSLPQSGHINFLVAFVEFKIVSPPRCSNSLKQSLPPTSMTTGCSWRAWFAQSKATKISWHGNCRQFCKISMHFIKYEVMEMETDYGNSIYTHLLRQTCSSVLRSPNSSRKVVSDGNCRGSRKFNKLNNSSTEFCRGVPVSRTLCSC